MRLNKILIFLLVISLVLSLYLASADYLIFNSGFYKKEFSKNNVYEKINNADDISKSLIGFFRDENKLPDVFDAKEKSHLEDVKDLIKNIQTLFVFLSLVNIILLSLLLFYSPKLKDLSKVGIYSGIFGLVLPIPFMIFKFSDLFIMFHLVLFPQGNWQFPINSTLIMLFPGQFFYDAIINIIITSVVFAFVFLLIGVFFCRGRVVTKLYSLLHKSL